MRLLPIVDGFEVCRQLRAQGVWSAVLMLTARDSIRDRTDGLDAGADDYLVKVSVQLPAAHSRPARPHPLLQEQLTA